MMDFPPDLLVKIGQVTVDAVELELALACLAVRVLGGEPLKLMTRPGKAVSEARRAVPLLTDLDPEQAKQRVEQAASLLQDRHTVVHAVWVQVTDGGQLASPLQLTPRTRKEKPVDVDELAEIARRLSTASAGLYAFMDGAAAASSEP